jgi:transposase-like protein
MQASKSINIAETEKVINSTSMSTAGRKQLAACRLVQGESVVDISRDMNIPARTIYGWLAQQSYRDYINKLRAAFVDECLGRLVGSATAAAESMVALLKSNDESIRLRAATTIIDTLCKLREHGEFARRLEVLESRGVVEVEMVEVDGDDVPDEAAEETLAID